MSFDGYLKNFVFAYNLLLYTGDDDIALKGSNNPNPVGLASTATAASAADVRHCSPSRTTTSIGATASRSAARPMPA